MRNEAVIGVAEIEPISEFWATNQPGFRFSDKAPGSEQFFDEVEAHRYALEPAIMEIVQFERWRARDVLEVGCGIGTDAIQFARAEARYTGVDLSGAALALARRRFELEDRAGRFSQAKATQLPFPNSSFDLVYSNGVLHHVPEIQLAVDEIHRVLRPGGVAIVMVYHRNSLNYRFNIMILRRALTCLLLVPRATAALASVTGEDRAILEGHRRLLEQHGTCYLRDKQLFLSNNTDGPGNPISTVLSRTDALSLFDRFARTVTQTRFLNLRLYPGGQRLSGTRLARRLERRYGWHLWIEAAKSGT